jgi:hypothetical protein
VTGVTIGGSKLVRQRGEGSQPVAARFRGLRGSLLLLACYTPFEEMNCTPMHFCDSDRRLPSRQRACSFLLANSP